MKKRIAVILLMLSLACPWVAVPALAKTPPVEAVPPEDGTEDHVGHGTAIAGIIVGSETAELEGVCPSAVLVPLVYATLDADGKPVKGDAALTARIIRDAVDLLAPGTNLRVVTPKGTRVRAYGTSYSAAYVSAAAARLLEQDSGLTPRELRQILVGGAQSH